MKAEDVRLTELLEGPKQFIVPVFQRDYSWGTKHCLQLWKDIVRVGSDANTKAHFVGSVVYVAAEENSAKITRWLLIDGQQRLTTVSLLLAALRNRVPAEEPESEHPVDDDGLPTRLELEDYYLRNTHGKGDRRHKLHLRRADQETMAAIVDAKECPAGASERIRENLEFFDEQLNNVDLELVYRGIKKLVAVDVCLTRGQDDPQMIFESLNSTGLDLTPGRPHPKLCPDAPGRGTSDTGSMRITGSQSSRPSAHGTARISTSSCATTSRCNSNRASSSRPTRIYQNFRTYFYGVDGSDPVEDTLAELKRFGTYYVAFSLVQEENPALKVAFRRLRLLVEVASPLVLKLYDCYSRAKTLPVKDFVTAVELLESYVFRRSVCAMQTRNLAQIFASLAYRIKEDAPLLSLKVALRRQGKKRRFPSDVEFREAMETRDVYDMRNCHYLLDRLENESKEKIDTERFTIEHVMPQNESLSAEWPAMLGEDWQKVQQLWLHRLVGTSHSRATTRNTATGLSRTRRPLPAASTTAPCG